MPRRSAPTEAPPEDPTSLPPLPKRPVPAATGSPLFVPPSTPPETSLPSPTPESRRDEIPSPLPDAPDWSRDGVAGPPSPDHSASSEHPSTGSGPKLSKAGLRAVAGVGFRKACRVLAAFLADQEMRDAGVWTPDEQEVKDVAEPTASLVYRRLPDDAKSGDVIDLFALGLAIVGYVGRNLAEARELRTARHLQAVQGIQADEGVTP